MPFLSQAQRRWGHSPTGKKALGGAAKVKEWESDTPSKLPETHKMKKTTFLGGAIRGAKTTDKPEKEKADKPKGGLWGNRKK